MALDIYRSFQNNACDTTICYMETDIEVFVTCVH